jgi:hypothetical protein
MCATHPRIRRKSCAHLPRATNNVTFGPLCTHKMYMKKCGSCSDQNINFSRSSCKLGQKNSGHVTHLRLFYSAEAVEWRLVAVKGCGAGGGGGRPQPPRRFFSSAKSIRVQHWPKVTQSPAHFLRARSARHLQYMNGRHTRDKHVRSAHSTRVSCCRSSIPRTSHADVIHMMRASYARHSSSKCDVKRASHALHPAWEVRLPLVSTVGIRLCRASSDRVPQLAESFLR